MSKTKIKTPENLILANLFSSARIRKFKSSSGGFFSNQRPYRDTSPWNTPIPSGVYTIASIGDGTGYIDNMHYENGLYIPGSPSRGKLMNQLESTPLNWLTSDPTQFTMALFFVNNNTPLVTVNGSGVFGIAPSESGPEILDSSGYSIQAPIPVEAAPCSGSDAQCVIVNLDSGDEWMFNGFGGTYPNFSASNGSKYNIGWLGVPPDGHPSIGAGIPNQIGCIRPWEIATGQISHALQILGNYPCGAQIFPATKSDGGSGSCLNPGFLRDSNSDLSVGGALFNKWLAKGQGAPDQSLSIVVPAGQTLDGFGFTNQGYFIADRSGAVGPDLILAPWSNELPGDGIYTLDLFINVGDPTMLFSFAVAKCTYQGTVLVESGFSSEVQLSTGQKRIQLSVSTLGYITETDDLNQDRIRIRFRFRSTAGAGNSQVTIRTNTVRSMLTPPFCGWVPEGSRLRLNPSLTDAEIAAWTDPLTGDPISSVAVTIAKCLRDYGAYYIDQSGNKKVRAECSLTANWTGILSTSTVRPIKTDFFQWVESPSHTIAPWWVPDGTI